MAGKLYVVATPIGNLEDISERAIRILKTSDIIAAEDTRVTRKLLSHFDIKTKLISYHQHSNETKAQYIISRIKEGSNVALVSDAGMPGISDPGYELIKNCIDSNVDIQCIPGPCALINALVLSGLSTSSFVFEGFLPRAKTQQQSYLRNLIDQPRTLVFYESPHRLIKTLQNIYDVFGDRKIAVARELTKIYEQTIRGNICEVISLLENRDIKGEIVIVVEGNMNQEKTANDNENRVRKEIASLIKSGLSEKDAIKEVCKKLNISRNLAYSIALELKNNI
ncbi:MAG: 16S rRNA (cytidine(1402)-2'-O)-methyltransferase [Armatimonadota bacterium]